MKKLIVLIMAACLILPIWSVTYAEPATVTQEDETIPPVEGYKFSMTPNDVHDLLGLPDEKNDRFDTYYDVNYFDISGHLGFYYQDGQVDSVAWESPAKKDKDENFAEIESAVVSYYDQKIGTDKDVKYKDISAEMSMIIWNDEFNKTEYLFVIQQDETGTKVSIGRQRSVKETVNNALSDAGIDLDELIADLDAAMNK